MFLARKITQAKWRPREGFAEGEIAADAVTVDLKTRCPSGGALQKQQKTSKRRCWR